MKLHRLRSFTDAERLRSAWDGMVERSCNAIEGLDVTQTFDWLAGVWASARIETGLEILAVEDEEGLAAIFPLYHVADRLLVVPRRGLATVAQLYSGRNGFLLRDERYEVFARALDRVLREMRWDQFVCTVVDGSVSDRFLRDYAMDQALPMARTTTVETPYIMLPERVDDLIASLPKKVRYNIRNSEKKLEQAGRLEFRQYRTPDEVAVLLEHMLQVERQSWKHQAGTAISTNERQERFYRLFTPVAAANGWLHAAALLHDGEPIAYVYGLAYGTVYYDFKESYCGRFTTIAPGHVLKRYLFSELCARGIRMFDYMGKAEAYKLQWTDRTYAQTTCVVFNRSIAGRLSAFKHALRRGRANAPPPAPGELAGSGDASVAA